MKLTGPLLLNFNESSIGETRCLSVLGSQKKNLENFVGVLFRKFSLSSPKKDKIMQERTLLTMIIQRIPFS